MPLMPILLLPIVGCAGLDCGCGFALGAGVAWVFCFVWVFVLLEGVSFEELLFVLVDCAWADGFALAWVSDEVFTFCWASSLYICSASFSASRSCSTFSSWAFCSASFFSLSSSFFLTVCWICLRDSLLGKHLGSLLPFQLYKFENEQVSELMRIEVQLALDDLHRRIDFESLKKIDQ